VHEETRWRNEGHVILFFDFDDVRHLTELSAWGGDGLQHVLLAMMDTERGAILGG
jgi:hypothetical protein